MQPKEFVLSKKEYKRYLNAVMRMRGTQLRKQLMRTRLFTALFFAVVITLVFFAQLPGALHSPGRLQTLGVTVLVEILLLAGMAWWMPAGSLRRRVIRMERLNSGKQIFTEPHRVWVEDGFYLHQVGASGANRVPLADLQWARPGEGCGVVVQFASGRADYLPLAAFHAGCPAPAWCSWLMEQAAAARGQELGEPTPPAVSEGECQVCFDLDAEQMVALTDEMTGLVMRTAGYWRYLAPQLVLLALTVLIVIPLAFTEPPVAAVLALALAAVVLVRLPPVRRALLRRQARRPETARLFLGPQSLTLTPQGVLARRTCGDNLLEYSRFRRVLAGKKGVYLVVRSGVQAYLIPNSAFPDEEARQAFIRQAESRLAGK